MMTKMVGTRGMVRIRIKMTMMMTMTLMRLMRVMVEVDGEWLTVGGCC